LHFFFATHFRTLATHFAPRKTYAARCLTCKYDPIILVHKRATL